MTPSSFRPTDQTTDRNGAEIYRIAVTYGLPDFVKSADADELLRPSQLPVQAYADPWTQTLPCHTPASTWLSAVTFLEKSAAWGERAPAVAERLTQFASYWNIVPSVVAVAEKLASAVAADPTASLPDQVFAYIVVDPRGRVIDRRLPLRDAGEVKLAVDYLRRYADQFSRNERARIADRVLGRADRLQIKLAADERDWLERTAGRGFCNPAEVVRALQMRGVVSGSPQMKAALDRLARTIATNPRAFTRPQLLKLAEVLDQVDRDLKLTPSSVLLPADELLFGVTWRKAAQDASSVCALTTGSVYDKRQFAKLSLDAVSELFGPEIADEVRYGLDRVDPEKMAAIASTLPRPDAELLDRLMAEAGQRPLMVRD